MRFHLGVVDPDWLARPEFEAVSQCVSRNWLMGYRAELRAQTRWMLDSSAFTEIERHGRWTVPPKSYARMAARCQREIGRMDMAAPQDWFCGPPHYQSYDAAHCIFPTHSRHLLTSC